MANTFKNEQVQDVTTGWSDVGTELNNTTQRTIIGMTIANTTSAVISVDVSIYNNSTTRTYLVQGAPIASGGSLIVVGGDQKVVLDYQDLIQVKSNTATSADVVMSLLDIT
jgi:hypothetical protein